MMCSLWAMKTHRVHSEISTALFNIVSVSVKSASDFERSPFLDNHSELGMISQLVQLVTWGLQLDVFND